MNKAPNVAIATRLLLLKCTPAKIEVWKFTDWMSLRENPL